MAETQAHPIEIYVNTIKGPEIQGLINKSLPKEIPAVKFTAAVIGAIKANQQVFIDCERQSVYNSIIEAARRGLVPDGKQGALVPFKKKVNGQFIKFCQFMIMPEGIIDSLARLGITIYAQSVHKNDKYRFWSDDKGQHVDHEFDPFTDRGERVGAFSCATTRAGVSYVEAMGMADISRVMKVSKQKDDQGNMTGPWKDWPERMEQKSCMHRVCKRTPNVDIGDDDEYTDRVVSVVPAANADDQKEQSTGNTATATPENTKPAAEGMARPKALQRIIDEETGQVLNHDELLKGEEVPMQQHQEKVYNPDGSPF